jgi:hypothetical protein
MGAHERRPGNGEVMGAGQSAEFAPLAPRSSRGWVWAVEHKADLARHQRPPLMATVVMATVPILVVPFQLFVRASRRAASRADDELAARRRTRRQGRRCC